MYKIRNSAAGKCLKILIIFLSLTSTLGLWTGCASTPQKESQKKLIELRKKNYLALQQQVINKNLLKGLSIDEIRNVYGEPDDIYRVGSTLGSIEVWTYGKGEDFSNPGDWHPIRLYFENNHLIDWSY